MSENGCDYYLPIRPDIQNCPNCRKWIEDKCGNETKLKKDGDNTMTFPIGGQVKPTLGVISKHLWDEQRRKDLIKAIVDRVSAGQEVPSEWMDEYGGLAIRCSFVVNINTVDVETIRKAIGGEIFKQQIARILHG